MAIAGYAQGKPVAIQQPQMRRRVRYPAHTWNVRFEPFQLCPIMIAPVLPGETLKNALFQARCVTDPVKSELTGWWLEHYFFYTKITDLEELLDIHSEADLRNMFLDPNRVLGSGMTQQSANSTAFYTPLGGVKWNELVMAQVTNHWFRDEGEDFEDHATGTYPSCQIRQQTFLDSVTLDSDMSHDDYNPDMADAGSTDGAEVRPSEVEETMRMYEFYKVHNLTDMSYEDFLRSYGVRKQLAEPEHKPELLRMSVEWNYPANSVDPDAGSVRSVVAWSIRDRIDKDRFFAEPGFITGYVIARPKIYLGNQHGNGASMMSNAWTWLPAMLENDKHVAWKHYDEGTGPLQSLDEATDAGYWVDVRDVLLHGDQYLNHALSADDAGIVALPSAANNKRYPTQSMIRDLFVDNSVSDFLCREDGVINLHIATRQMDQSPRSRPA